jgi:hypothetical protein
MGRGLAYTVLNADGLACGFMREVLKHEMFRPLIIMPPRSFDVVCMVQVYLLRIIPHFKWVIKEFGIGEGRGT